MNNLMLACFAVALLTGCGGILGHKESSQITLEAALTSVGKSLTDFHNAQGELATGLVPESVEVTFNISASKDKDNSLMVTLGTPPTVPVSAGLSGGVKNSSSESSSNKITIKMTNIFLAGDKSIFFGKTDVQIKAIFDYLAKNKIQSILVPTGIDQPGSTR